MAMVVTSYSLKELCDLEAASCVMVGSELEVKSLKLISILAQQKFGGVMVVMVGYRVILAGEARATWTGKSRSCCSPDSVFADWSIDKTNLEVHLTGKSQENHHQHHHHFQDTLFDPSMSLVSLVRVQSSSGTRCKWFPLSPIQSKLIHRTDVVMIVLWCWW